MSIKEDVLEMIRLLQQDKRYNPFELYLPDEGVRTLGGDPEDYPELDGFPGVRVVRADSTWNKTTGEWEK